MIIYLALCLRARLLCHYILGLISKVSMNALLLLASRQPLTFCSCASEKTSPLSC